MPEKIKPKIKIANPITDKELSEFADWTGSGGIMDTKVAAKDLLRRGLIGAHHIVDAPVDIKDPRSIKNSQADWKPAAIQEILMNAKKFNIRTPEEVKANMAVLLQTPKYRDAIGNPAFKQIHPNFWQIISNSILPQQYAKEDNKKMLASRTAKTIQEFLAK